MSSKTKFTEIPGLMENINEFIQKLPLAVVVVNLDREIVAFNRHFFLMAGREICQGTPHCYDFLNFEYCHNRSANFKLTEQSLDHLKKELIPEEIVAQLSSLRDQGFRSKEGFLKAVDQEIGEELTKNYGELISTHADNCLAHMATLQSRTITWDESQGICKNGEELIIRPTVIPLMGRNEAVQGHILVFQNTTDEVHLYRNFRVNLNHLERKVAFLQTLNEAADEFRQIKKVDVLLKRATEFAVVNLSIESCQLIQKKNNQFVVAKAFHDPAYVIDETREQQLLESILPGIQAFKQEPDTPFYILHFHNQPGPAKQFKSMLFPIRSGSADYGYLVTHHFSKEEGSSEELEWVATEQQEYLELFAKQMGPYIENCDIIANLESIVAERTYELKAAQEQLMDNTRLAAVGELAGLVAHEVLNPMTAILARIRKLQGEDGGLGIMEFIAKDWDREIKERGLDQFLENLKGTSKEGDIPLVEEDLFNIKEGLDELSIDLRFIEEQMHRIVGIVDNLRGLSRKRNQAQNVDVKEPIEKTVELIRDGLRERHIQLVTDYQHSATMTCDPEELVQVFHNLTRNAIQAMRQEGTLSITTTETVDRVEVRVKDSGPGIPSDIVPKIFSLRFTTKGAQEGTGLGLNLCRRLVRQVMGDVELESPGGNGSGAVFLCWIPKEKQEISTSN